jgi:hypothetical protein
MSTSPGRSVRSFFICKCPLEIRTSRQPKKNPSLCSSLHLYGCYSALGFTVLLQLYRVAELDGLSVYRRELPTVFYVHATLRLCLPQFMQLYRGAIASCSAGEKLI